MAKEKRLIDANALMDAFRSHMVKSYDRNKCTLEENCKTCEPGCLWRKKVSEAPTVDAVEVVRCKDCKHYVDSPYDNGDMMCDCWGEWIFPNDDDFCSCGERKDNE